MLLDADGVLQHLPGGWIEGVRPYLGDRAEEFMRRSWSQEGPCLRGEADFREVLAGHLSDFGLAVDVDRLIGEVWHSIEIVPSSVELVHRLRAAGYGVHLGSNQERHRAAYMRETLGYDALFDVSCYSHDLGAAKPDPVYFERAVERIGVEPGEVLFVDDLADNVASARSVGLIGVHWTLADGLAVIESQLAEAGVRIGA